jgi:aryl-alcohol dehydrogenase-like predicted oxidoreductase
LTEENIRIVERLADFCAARGRTLLELAFSWLLNRPAVVSVIAGASTPEQLEQNVAAIEWSLGPEDMSEIDQLLV